MKASVFYSWQSDTHPPATDDRIRNALAAAIEALTEDTSLVVRPELDHDTRRVPGSPPMVEAILRKIDQCSVMVADVTLTYERVSGDQRRRAPNPNVLFELGYAFKRLGHGRVLLVLDTYHGPPEQLPFDLRGNRVLTFDGRVRAGAGQLDEPLVEQLRSALHLIITSSEHPSDLSPPARIDLSYVVRAQRSDRHEYRLPVFVENTGSDILTDWSVEVTFPRALLEPHHSYPITRTLPNGMVVMRQTEATHSGPIYPGEKKELIGIDYYMDNNLFDQSASLFSKEVFAAFFVGSKQIAKASTTVANLQKF